MILYAKRKINRDINYNLLDLLVTMYIEIEDLKQPIIATNKPYSIAQLITFSLKILKSTRNFEDSMKTWNARPDINIF